MLVDLLISQSLLEMASFDIEYLLVILLYKLNMYNGTHIMLLITTHAPVAASLVHFFSF